jgi:hypothetical protein
MQIIIQDPAPKTVKDVQTGYEQGAFDYAVQNPLGVNSYFWIYNKSDYVIQFVLQPPDFANYLYGPVFIPRYVNNDHKFNATDLVGDLPFKVIIQMPGSLNHMKITLIQNGVVTRFDDYVLDNLGILSGGTILRALVLDKPETGTTIVIIEEI